MPSASMRAMTLPIWASDTAGPSRSVESIWYVSCGDPLPPLPMIWAPRGGRFEYLDLPVLKLWVTH